MKQDIKITIYVPCRNYGKYLQQCLDSFKNQLFKEWELFIVNEDSSDDTEIISKNFIIQNADKMNMKYIHNISPQGIQKIELLYFIVRGNSREKGMVLSYSKN